MSYENGNGQSVADVDVGGPTNHANENVDDLVRE